MALRTWRWTIALAAAALAAGCFDLEMPDRAEADCLDPESDVCWQRLSFTGSMTWLEAVDYCDSMGFGGYDWRLPSIGELRSLVQGCAGTETGGGCGVTDDCLDYDDCVTSECGGCESMGGPGYAGCYWDPSLDGPCGGYWSSSPWTGYSMNAWVISFDSGAVSGFDKNSYYAVRCVADVDE